MTATEQPNLGVRSLWQWRAFWGTRIPQKALALFFDQFAVLLGTGTPITDALERAAAFADSELVAICAAIRKPLLAGVPLSRALQPWRNRFPEIVLPILEVGELSGTLETSARRLAFAFQQGASIEQRIRYSVFDPKIVLAVIVLDVMGHTLSPDLMGMLRLGLQTLLHLGTLYLLGGLIVRFVCRWPPVRLALDTLKLALPQLGITLRNLAAARWGRSFATLWQCGIPVSQALEVSALSAQNAHYEQAILRAAQQTRNGCSLSDSLAGTQLLPAHLLEMIAVGETSGDLGASLERVTALMEAEAFTRASQQFVLVLMFGQALLMIGAIALMFR